ncbi:hypothetical protein QEN19_003967 [Hanseniaspora menglaensis]
MTLEANKTAVKGNTILFERKFIPLQQDVSYNNLNILNDGKILLLVDDDENSVTTTAYEHGFLSNLPGLDIEKPLKNSENDVYTLSQFYQRRQFCLSASKENQLGINKFVRMSNQLGKYQELIHSQYKTSIKRVIKNDKYPIFLVFTNNFNILSFDYKHDNYTDSTNHQHFKFLQNIDHNSIGSNMLNLKHRIYYDAVFDASGDYLFISNRDSSVLVFKFNPESKQFDYIMFKQLPAVADEYIVNLKSVQMDSTEKKLAILGKTNNNNFYKIVFDLNETAANIKTLSLTHKQFMISDFISVCDKIYYISANKLYDETNKEIASFSNYDLKQIRHIKSQDQLIIYSNNELYTLDLKTNKLVETPVLKFLTKKHNTSKLDNFNLSLNIHGIDATDNESVLGILYSFTTNGGVRYVTSADRDISLSLIKLKKNWNLTGSDYNDSVKLWYFQYKFFGNQQPENYQDLLNEQNSFNKTSINYDMPFEAFIQENIIKNKHMKFNKYQALNENTSVLDSLLYNRILTHFYNYAKHHSDKIISSIDLFSIAMICCKLNAKEIFSFENKDFDFSKILFKGAFMEDTFNAVNCFDNDKLISNNGYSWKYCFLTLLPLLTSNTKHCSITNVDIIDIEKDFVFNEYGWFTKTILTELGERSIVSDMEYI